MTDLFSPSVEKIVADYLERLSDRLKGMPEADRRDLVDEIRSHLFESFAHEPGDDEIARILAVLRRLGDPAEVISSRVPGAMARVGRERKAPLYILAGVLIALFGVPLGLGAVGLLVGLLAALFGLLVGYFATAVSLTVAGFLAALACLMVIVFPDLAARINQLAGQPVIQFGIFSHDPMLGAILGLIGSALLAGVGLLMLWAGKHLWRGMRLVANLIAERVRRIFFGRGGQPA